MITATYSPDDNKLRLYPEERLDDKTYQRVKAAGYRWAPRQELFVAPMWTPGREDLALELAGTIGDEDTSLTERAEERAERFGEYSDKRATEADQAHSAVRRIADHIPMGQPILVGHHSERHARKDQQRIENGMRKAVKLWDTSTYWTMRAEGALRNAKYKERPDVRARRIRKIEADTRKQERSRDKANDMIFFWTRDEIPHAVAVRLAGGDYVDVVQEDGTRHSLYDLVRNEKITVEEAREHALSHYRGIVAWCERWIAHYTLRLTYERAMLGEQGGLASDRKGLEKGGAVQCWASPGHGRGWSYIQKVNKVTVSVLDNWGNGGRNFRRTIKFDQLSAIMSAAEVAQSREDGRLVDTNDGTGFFLIDNAPKVEDSADAGTQSAPTTASNDEEAADEAASSPKEVAQVAAYMKFDSMRQQLREGVRVEVVPQLFPTPPHIVRRMIELAQFERGMSMLDPSAGDGRIMHQVREAVPGVLTTGVEINFGLYSRLSANFDSVRQADFLTCGTELGAFDRVLMNPPFAKAVDIKHIEHAFSFLKPGGRLVAICANGPRQNRTLRELVEQRGGQWEELPTDTFKDAGTSVQTVLLTMNREAA